MTPDALERDIRTALEAEARSCPVPEDLAERTLARAAPPAGLEGGPGRGHLARPRVVLYGAAAVVTVVFFFAVGAVVTGPTGPSTGPSARQSGRAGTLTTGDRPPQAGEPAPSSGEAQAPSGGFSPPPAHDPGSPSPFGPRISRRANVEVRVQEGRFDERWRTAEAVASRHGGFVTGSSAEEDEGRLARGNLTLQVPVDRLQAALDEFRALGTPVRLTTSATDVSGQLVDYEARLRAAQSNEAQLLELLKQARTVEDNLALRPRLQEARREVETLQAQKAALQGKVDLASVNASLYERRAGPSFPRPEGRIGQAWERAGDAAASTLAGIIVTAGYLGPPVLLGVVLWAMVATVRRRRLL